MTGRLIIDGIDAFTQFGVYVTEGGYDELITYPALKGVDFNDWPDEHGIDPDLSAPALDTRELTISFASRGPFQPFVDFLATPGYRVCNFAAIGLTFNLRLVKQADLDVNEGLDIFALVFADDFPPTTSDLPAGGIATNSGYFLDSNSFSDYGLTVLQGSLKEVLKKPDVKRALTINQSGTPGAVYDGVAPIIFKSKEVTLNLLLRANTLAHLWANYFTFLLDLTLPGYRTLYVEPAGMQYKCYYKKSNVETFLPGHCWLHFSLTLEFIDNGQPL